MVTADSRSRARQLIQGLYVITHTGPAQEILARTEHALRGGARVIQLRDKHQPLEQQLDIAAQLRALCRRYAACFIVNDSVELARRSNADGVHLGQDDGEVKHARAVLGPHAVIGVSTKCVADAKRAREHGADYIGCGSVFPTDTKGDAVHIGLDELRQVCACMDIPVVAIGGISAANLPQVLEQGAASAAVISAVMHDARPDMAARELSLMFRRNEAPAQLPCGTVLTIAGSDSGGGAGIQADIKTITLLGSYAASAITALTAQNTMGVQGIFPVPSAFVAQQITSVLDDIGADVIKTGMLLNAEIIATVAETLHTAPVLNVIDPVMIAKGGANLLEADAVTTFRDKLLPHTYLLTPNIPEAEHLSATAIRTREDMEQAATILQQMGARHVLIKGGHLEGAPIDLLRYGSSTTFIPGERIETAHTHGTGCTTAAALAALLARGLSLSEATRNAKAFIQQAISTAPGIGQGHGPVNHYTAATALCRQLHQPSTGED